MPLKLLEHKLCIHGEMIHQILHGRFVNEEDTGTLLLAHAESKPTLKYGSQTWIFSAYDEETFIGSAHGISEVST